jgi:putative DNA primase/helicase
MMNRTENALQFISSDDREVWVSMGMALRSEFGDAAREIWMDWSRQSDSFKESDARAVWRSFKGSGVTLGSLLHEAKQNGWKDEGFQRPTPEQYAAQRRAVEERQSLEGQERARLAHRAADKAKWILDQVVPEEHAYLQSKGFPELQGLVWRPTQESNLLVIPMFVGKSLSGVQLINRAGEKKYLTGAVTAKAEYVFDNNSINAQDFWCEGFATGLALRECLAALKKPYRIHITFSAQNLKRMAHSGYVIADHDVSGVGQQVAEDTGLPYWMPDVAGTDLNDVWKAQGTFRASQALRKWLMSLRIEAV